MKFLVNRRFTISGPVLATSDESRVRNENVAKVVKAVIKKASQATTWTAKNPLFASSIFVEIEPIRRVVYGAAKVSYTNSIEFVTPFLKIGPELTEFWAYAENYTRLKKMEKVNTLIKVLDAVSILKNQKLAEVLVSANSGCTSVATSLTKGSLNMYGTYKQYVPYMGPVLPRGPIQMLSKSYRATVVHQKPLIDDTSLVLGTLLSAPFIYFSYRAVKRLGLQLAKNINELMPLVDEKISFPSKTISERLGECIERFRDALRNYYPKLRQKLINLKKLTNFKEILEFLKKYKFIKNRRIRLNLLSALGILSAILNLMLMYAMTIDFGDSRTIVCFGNSPTLLAFSWLYEIFCMRALNRVRIHFEKKSKPDLAEAILLAQILHLVPLYFLFWYTTSHPNISLSYWIHGICYEVSDWFYDLSSKPGVFSWLIDKQISFKSTIAMLLRKIWPILRKKRRDLLRFLTKKNLIFLAKILSSNKIDPVNI